MVVPGRITSGVHPSRCPTRRSQHHGCGCLYSKSAPPDAAGPPRSFSPTVVACTPFVLSRNLICTVPLDGARASRQSVRPVGQWS